MRILAERTRHVHGLAHSQLFETRPGVADNHGRIIAAGLEEVEIITAGKAFFAHGGREHVLGPGAICWHLAGERTVHRADPRDPYHCVVVGFRVSGPAPHRPPRLTLPADGADSRAFALQIFSAWCSGGGDRDLLAGHAYLGLLWRAVRAPAATAGAPPAELRRALDELDRRHAEPLQVVDVATAAGVSVAHLHLLMRRHLRSTPWQELAARRLAAARQLLATTDQPVAGIGAAVGWPDPVHFGRIFRQREGLSPGAWRRRHRLG
ncbi:hypothetical protein LBMAG53_00090 [Planctomycetota bacterium]|nr:hypothetical protein LBMAG53_00090 [Planctomycetota bacterium]